MKLEIGGGLRNRGGDWVNLDICDTANIRHDLNITPCPVESDSVSECYSSHCIEHVRSPIDFVREVARVCRVGASVEISCPDAMSEMAMVAGHESSVSMNFMRHMDNVFPSIFWAGLPKRLRIVSVQPGCDDYWFPLARANPLFSSWSDMDILTWLPRTRHENRFHLTVEECTL